MHSGNICFTSKINFATILAASGELAEPRKRIYCNILRVNQMKRKILYSILFCLVAQTVCFAKLPQDPRSEVTLTIYNDNFGVVRESLCPNEA